MTLTYFILAPTLLTLPYRTPSDLVLPHLPSQVPLITAPQSHWPAFCSTNSMFSPCCVQPSGLCVCCSLCLDCASAGRFFLLIHVSPSHRGIPWSPHLKRPHPLPRQSLFRTVFEIISRRVGSSLVVDISSYL